jgi:hypothetical protein
MQYQAFHSGSSNGIGRDKLHFFESLNMPFPLPDHEFVALNAKEIVREVASIFKEIEGSSKNAAPVKRSERANNAWFKIQPLVEEYLPIRSINSSYSEFQAAGRDEYPTPGVAGLLPATLTRVSADAGYPLRRRAV